MPEEHSASLHENQQKILQKLEEMETTLEIIAQELNISRRPSKVTVKPPVEIAPTGMSFLELLELPDNIRKTVLAVSQLGEATADEVAEKTERVRNVESHYLNTLVHMDHLQKKRKGRKVYFTVKYKR